MAEFEREFKSLQARVKRLPFEEASAAWRELAARYRRRPEPWLELARLCYQCGRLPEGDEALSRAARLNSRHPEVLRLQGLAAIQRADFSAAVKPLKRLVKLLPEDANARYHLGLALGRSGRPKDGVAELTEAARLRPRDPLTQIELGAQLADLGRWEESTAAFKRAIRLERGAARAYLGLARCLLAQGKVDDAVATYRRGLAATDRDPELLSGLIDALLVLRQAEQAVVLAQELARRRGEYQDLLKLGSVALIAGDVRLAEESFRRAAESAPERWEAWYDLAELYFAERMFERARSHYLRALERRPEDYKPYNGLGLLLLHLGADPREVREHLQQARALAPDRPEPELNLALSYAQTGQKRRALRHAEAALRKAGDDQAIVEQARRLIAQLQAG